ncbi:MAG: phospholipid carrier-dependent glycosyltransferase [Novosphingobium sp.]
MTPPPDHQRDPIGWTMAFTVLFFSLCLVRLTFPHQLFFDEIHYVPAADRLRDLSTPMNREHPLVGKELIALGMALFGDRPLGWRIMSVLAGSIATFAWMRALWLASRSRFATLAGGVLLITSFMLFVQARIAMLDVFLAAFSAIAYWQLAAAVTATSPAAARRHLAAAGVALGLALGSKWTVVPLVILPGLAFFIIRLEATGWHFLSSKAARPVPGVSVLEAALWLGILPLCVYFMTFLPMLFFDNEALTIADIIPFQMEMLRLQQSVIKPHPYQSVWYEWVTNWRALWYFYEPADGAQRGVLLIGNPFTMLLGLVALAWCAFQGLFRKRPDALAITLIYAAGIGFWIVAAKPVQFYYHYLLCSMALMAALALWLDALWEKGHRLVPLGTLALAIAIFVYFFPILTAAPLAGKMGFLDYTWLDSWR